MFSNLSVGYEDHEAFYSSNAFAVWAHLRNINIVFSPYCDWAVYSTLVLGVSWASLFRTDYSYSPLFSTLMAMVSVYSSLKIAQNLPMILRYVNDKKKRKTHYWRD